MRSKLRMGFKRAGWSAWIVCLGTLMPLSPVNASDIRQPVECMKVDITSANDFTGDFSRLKVRNSCSYPVLALGCINVPQLRQDPKFSCSTTERPTVGFTQNGQLYANRVDAGEVAVEWDRLPAGIRLTDYNFVVCPAEANGKRMRIANPRYENAAYLGNCVAEGSADTAPRSNPVAKPAMRAQEPSPSTPQHLRPDPNYPGWWNYEVSKGCAARLKNPVPTNFEFPFIRWDGTCSKGYLQGKGVLFARSTQRKIVEYVGQVHDGAWVNEMIIYVYTEGARDTSKPVVCAATSEPTVVDRCQDK